MTSPNDTTIGKEIKFCPDALTLDQWGNHYGVSADLVKKGMRTVMMQILRADSILDTKQGDAQQLDLRRKIIKSKHRSDVEGPDAEATLLSEQFQLGLLRVLNTKKYKRSEYLLISDVKGKKSFMNQDDINKAWRDIRKVHPEWFCKTGTTSGGMQSTWGAIKIYEKEFRAALSKYEEELAERRMTRTEDLRSITPVATDSRGLRGWGDDLTSETGIVVRTNSPWSYE